MRLEQKIEIPELNDISLGDLLKRSEDETFDRTLGTQESIGKKIAGFGTKNGGILLVGQQDLKEGGKIVGINEEEFHKEFGNAISNVKPTPLTQQKIVKIGESKVALIRVQDVGVLRPCSYNGLYYERKGNTTPRLGPDEIKRYHLLYGSASAEDMPTHAKKTDIDETELELYARLLSKSKENILHTITASNGYLSVRGVVILSKKPEDHLEGMFVEIQRYDNFIGSAPNPVGAAIKISMPARQLIEEAAKVVEQNLPTVRSYEGAKMIQTPSIPSSIIREAITNAVAHRNYRSHEHIRIRIYSDGFDISNPAVINEKMWEEILANQTTYHPNEGIYTFLNPAQLYEGRGEGIWKIKEELAELGKTAPEFKVIGDGPSAFYARISLTPAKIKDVKRKKLAELISSRKELTTSDVMKKCDVSRVTAITLLNELVKQQILEHQGTTKTSKYLVKIFQQRKDQ
jgi:ATP-dependent DNA helicase RecG